MQRIGKYCNCKNPQCTSPGNNYECCSENVPNGGTPRYGLWVESNYCDKTKGLPLGAENNESYTLPTHRNTGNIENYRLSNRYDQEEEEQEEQEEDTYTDEEDDVCTNWKSAFYAIFILMIVAMILCTVIYLKSNNRLIK
jgi:hypothetical protein